MAHDGIVATIDELRSKYSTRSTTEQELRRLERRGTRAVRRIERDVKQSRTRIARECKQKLRSMTKAVEAAGEPVTKNAEYVTARVKNAVQEPGNE